MFVVISDPEKEHLPEVGGSLSIVVCASPMGESFLGRQVEFSQPLPHPIVCWLFPIRVTGAS